MSCFFFTQRPRSGKTSDRLNSPPTPCSLKMIAVLTTRLTGKHIIYSVTDSQYGSRRTEQRAGQSLAVLVCPLAHFLIIEWRADLFQITSPVLDCFLIRKFTGQTPNYAGPTISYANSKHTYSWPRISAMSGDGKTQYDHDHDNESHELAGCSVGHACS